MLTPLPMLDGNHPSVSLAHLDELWFQVAGTVCNLECRHCFISCSPHNRSFGCLDLETVRRWLDESVSFGVKEYYFTGGERLLNPDMPVNAELSSRRGSATVLTHETVRKNHWLDL